MSRWRRHEVGAPIEHADVHEPGQGIERAVPAIGRHRRREELVDRRPETVERGNPPRGRELRRPDHVELQHIGLADVRVEPLDVELVALVGVVGRGAQLDRDLGMRGAEPLELPARHLAFAAEEAARQRQHSFAVPPQPPATARMATPHPAIAQLRVNNTGIVLLL